MLQRLQGPPKRLRFPKLNSMATTTSSTAERALLVAAGALGFHLLATLSKAAGKGRTGVGVLRRRSAVAVNT